MATISLNLSRILLACAAIVGFSLVLFLIAQLLVAHPTLNVEDLCVRTEISSSSCTFNCIFKVDCKGQITSRIIVLHFNWDAIYDNTTTFYCNQNNEVTIQLPYRNYTYIMRGAFYGSEYGVAQEYLQC